MDDGKSFSSNLTGSPKLDPPAQTGDNPLNRQKRSGKKHIDKLVLQYLRAKGYENAQKVFAKEALPPGSMDDELEEDDLEQSRLLEELEARIEPEIFFKTQENESAIQEAEAEVETGIEPFSDKSTLQKNQGDTDQIKTEDQSTQKDEDIIQQKDLKLKSEASANKLATQELIMRELKGLESAGNNVDHLYELFNKNENSRMCLYDSSFSKLLAWVDISLDFYKEELFTVSYPIFVHCFLKLMASGASGKGLVFLDKHKNFYIQSHGDQIQELENIRQNIHVSENDLAKQFSNTRYSINMTTSAVELLLLFLESNNLILIIDIINSHLNICIINSDDINRNDIKFDIGLTGLGINDISKLNQDAVYLGQIPLNPHLKTEVDRVLKSDVQRLSSMNLQGKKIIDPQELLNNFNKIKSPEADAQTKIDIPLPPLKGYDVIKQIEKLKDLSRRVKVDPNNLPSISMFTLQNTDNTMTSAAISENLELMACGFAESYVKIWNVKKEPIGGFKSQFNLVTIEDEGDLNRIKNKSGDSYKLIGHSGPVYSLDFSKDNLFLISGSEDKTVRLWSTETLSNLVCYRGHNYPVWDVAFSPIGVYFASASYDRTARLWSCEHIYPLRIFVGHLSDVTCVVFHSNSKYIVTGSDDKTVRMWDIQSGKCVRLFTGHRGPITCVSISPDGKLLASASTAPFKFSSESKKAGDNNKKHSTFGQAEGISPVEPLFRPKKKESEESGLGIVIKVWDIGSGANLFNLYGHTETITSLAFNNESTLLISGSLDTTVRTWNVTKTELPTGQTQTNETHNSDLQLGRKNLLDAAENENEQGVASKVSLDLKKAEKDAQRTIKDAAGAWKSKYVKKSKELIKTWNTVSSPIYSAKFSSRNLAVVIGAYLPSEKK